MEISQFDELEMISLRNFDLTDLLDVVRNIDKSTANEL